MAARKPRPDPGPIRIALGLTGMATATALITAFLGPSAGTGSASSAAIATVDLAPVPSVRHITRIVQLQPGQTAPPLAVVQAAPVPTPRVVVVTTRQSGARP